MKRLLLLLTLMIALVICFALSAAAESGRATFYYNDAKVTSVSRNADGSFILPAAPDTGARKFIGWVLKDDNGHEGLYAADATYGDTAGKDLRFDALTVDFCTMGGAAVSYNAPNVLRFDGAIAMTDHQRLISLLGAENVTFGMLIAPYNGTNGKIFDKINAPAGTVDRTETAFLYSTDEWGVFSGRSNEIADSGLLEKYCARAYLSLRINGTEKIFYADYDVEKHTRSVHGVTAAAFTDRAGSATDTHPHLTDAGCYSRYDGGQLNALRARLDKVVYVSILENGSVQNKYSRDNYTFYTYDCVGENGQILHHLYTSPYKVEKVISNDPIGYDTYVVTGVDGADFNTVTAYFIGGSYRAPDRAEWREDGIYISVEQPKD